MSGRGRGRGRGSTLPAWMTTNHQNGGAEVGRSCGRGDRDQWNREEGRGRSSTEFVREENNATRGRGRGGGITNRPAWMMSKNVVDNNHGPLGGNKNDKSALTGAADDETMELLLAQARQKQQQQQKQNIAQRQDASASAIQDDTRNSGTNSASKKTSSKSNEATTEQQRKIEEDANEAARKIEEEKKRLELLREEEEQRQLRALVGDLSDNDGDNEHYQEQIAGMSDRDDIHEKRKQRNEGDDDDDDALFEFETEEEREEKASRRREERRRKLRKLEQSKHLVDVLDRPRNEVGIIQSEKNAIDNIRSISTKMEVDDKVAENNDHHDNAQEENNSDDDLFDIFATTDNATPVPTYQSKNVMSNADSKNNTAATAQECDDAEGYYKANIGEIIALPREVGSYDDDVVRFRVLGIIGKGVFSSVIKCVEENATDNHKQDAATQRVVAMKVIRNNEVMAKAAAKEIRILRMLCSKNSRVKSKGKNSKKDSDDNDDEVDKEEQERQERENHNIVRLLEVDGASFESSGRGDPTAFAAPPIEFRSHCIFLFEYLPHNLREVLNKFGKNVGINLTAVKSYARQLLCALRHLEKHRIVHSDIKPDNILVSANYSTLKLCDFGSAFFETDHDNDPTPYLVSRFYRPPEVILGLEYDRMVDLWSVGVTISELYTGSVLFPGNNNNDMLKKFMDAMGPFSYKMARRHAASYSRMGLQPHFEIGNTGGTYEFRQQDVDKVTGGHIVRTVNVLTAKTEASLAQVLLKASKGTGGTSERVEVLKFANFLNRCLALDPTRRLSVRNALQHEFFAKKKKKEENA